MTPTNEGTFDHDLAGGFVQGPAGDKNRITTGEGIYIMILIDENTENPFIETTFPVDISAFNTQVDRHLPKVVKVVVAWLPQTSGAFFDIIPIPFTAADIPTEFTIRKVSRPPTVSELQSLFASQRSALGSSVEFFVLVDTSGSMNRETVEPNLRFFTRTLGGDSAVLFRGVREFSDERWIGQAAKTLEDI